MSEVSDIRLDELIELTIGRDTKKCLLELQQLREGRSEPPRCGKCGSALLCEWCRRHELP